jgi:hypothetical protein
MKRTFLTIILILFTVVYGFSQKITGTWNGTLDLGTSKLRIVFHIEEKDGIYISTFDSPDQAAYNIPVSKTTLKKKILRISMMQQVAVFEGKVRKNVIEGIFTQMGNPMVLTLTRGDIEFSRPKNPKPPFSYNSEDVKFRNEQDGITLAGTFTYPKTSNNFPVAVLISGSGAQNRDEEMLRILCRVGSRSE